MEIHNPKNLNLPALKIEKKLSRKKMEKNTKISNFISSNLLLVQEFCSLFFFIKGKSCDIENNIQSLQRFRKPTEIETLSWGRSNSRIRKIYWEYLEKGKGNQITKEVRKHHFKKLVNDIKQISKDIQEKLSKFESHRKVNLDILTPLTLYICKECNNLISKNRFRSGKCICGTPISAVSKTKIVSIVFFEEFLRNFINNNFWLEYGIDYLLRKNNFQTLCGYHVLGHSGFMHEIDNIGESKKSNFRFFCECKTCTVKAQDVLILAGKMADIGCSKGYIFTVEKDMPKDILHLARSRNIFIIDDVLEKSESKLLEKITEKEDG